MRIRLGHVTNSSSTNHIIMWRGAKDDLRRLLEAHAHVFPTGCDWIDHVGGVSVDEIINAICSMSDRIHSSDQSVKNYQRNIEYQLHSIEETRKEILESEKDLSWKKEYLNYSEAELEELRGRSEMAQIMDWELVVSFGDNHGDFQGGDLGYIMDYEGRSINIKEDTLFYTTEQDR